MYVYCNVSFPHIYIQTSYSQNHFFWNVINLPAIITIIFRFPILSETIPIIIELKEKVKCIPYIINFTSQYLIFKCIFIWSKHDICFLNAENINHLVVKLAFIYAFGAFNQSEGSSRVHVEMYYTKKYVIMFVYQ